jgi:hypothetical protein
VFRIWGFATTSTMRLTRALLHYRLDDDNDAHFKALEDAPYTGLPWPDSEKLNRIVDTMVETCEKYEVWATTKAPPEIKHSAATPCAASPPRPYAARSSSSRRGPTTPKEYTVVDVALSEKNKQIVLTAMAYGRCC